MSSSTTLYLNQPSSLDEAAAFVGTRFLRRRNSKMCKGWCVRRLTARQL